MIAIVTSTEYAFTSAIPPTPTEAPVELCIPEVIFPTANDVITDETVTFRWLPCESVTARRNPRAANGIEYKLHVNNVVISPIRGTSYNFHIKDLPGAGGSGYSFSVGACAGGSEKSIAHQPLATQDCLTSETTNFTVQASSMSGSNTDNGNGSNGGGNNGDGSNGSNGPMSIIVVNITEALKYYTFNGAKIAMHICPFGNKFDSGCQLRYLHGDHLGSILMTTDLALDTGEEQRKVHRRYDAYGLQWADQHKLNPMKDEEPSDDLATDHGFTGQKADGTGLMYYNARYYDPEIGQFISPDSIVPDPTNVFDYNRYLYVRGNPLRYTDSSGHCIDGITTAVCVMAVIAGISLAVDYGMTAYDVYQASQVIADPNAGRNDKLMAGLNIGLAAVTELVEPDELLPIGLPFDDIGRRAIMRGANDALEAGGEGGLRNYISDAFGEQADEVLSYLDNLIPCNSFSAGTLVMTQAGLKRIAELVVGDIVLAYHEETGKIGPYPIIATISHVDPQIVLLTVDDEALETTAEHPFYEFESAPWLAIGQYEPRWTDAIDLSAGDLVWRADGSMGAVQSVEVVHRSQRMYNLTIGEAHTFFVGRGQWLVHNAGPCPAPSQISGIPGLTRAKPKTSVQGGGGLRKRWKDRKGNIYEWDSRHGTLEKYNKRGTHLGEFDAQTGEPLKPADKTRRVEP